MSENEPGPERAEEPEATAEPEKTASDTPDETVAAATEDESAPDADRDLLEAREEARDLHERLARVSAELDNYRKRTQREKEQAIAYANEQLLLEVIPVVDNFERALAADGDPTSVVRGVQLVKKQLEDVLGRFGAAPFTTVGEPFDPAKAEAVAIREDVAAPPGTVIDEHQRGWSLRGRLVRPARVVVAAQPAGDGGADDDVKEDGGTVH